MLSSQIVDGIIYLYLGYSLFVGFKNGVFNVIVSIFGIYGACFFSWIFQDSALRFLVENLNVATEINPVFLFILVWAFFYILFFVSAKLITGVLQLKGINLMVRVSGGVLNFGKGALVLILLLTFISSLTDSFYEETQSTKFFTGVGSNLMSLYNDTVDEQQIVPNTEMIVNETKDLIDDDFKHNLLER